MCDVCEGTGCLEAETSKPAPVEVPADREVAIANLREILRQLAQLP